MSAGATTSAPPPPPQNPAGTGTASAPKRPSNDMILDEKGAIARFDKLRKLVFIQTWVVAVLAGILVIVLPFAQPIYTYYAMNPEKQKMQMVGLDMPNMTNRAILSWSVTSITEIMTMGFGDMDVRLPQQKIRFTERGWKAFGKAFVNEKIGESFKQNQLVLTTVPSNTPVIVAQFVNSDDIYQWVVQMPVIMTYATNNNATRRENAIVTLTIVRVPSEVSSAGIAIQNWALYVGNG